MKLTQDEIANVYHRHADTVYRVCFTYLKNCRMDIEDALQTTFLSLIRSGKRFSSPAHEKAWLIVAASNTCKNMLQRHYRKDTGIQPDIPAPAASQDATLETLLKMPENIRQALYLHYYEGYTAAEIGRMSGKKESTVWGYLHQGRKMLKSLLEEEYDETSHT